MQFRRLAFFSLVVFLTACSGNNSADKTTDLPKESAKETKEEQSEPAKTDAAAVIDESDSKSVTSTEDRIIDKVYNLPEVQALEASVRKKSGGERNLSLRISSEPSDDQEYYGVTVAEDNGAALATYYEFRVYPDFSIRFYDVVEDSEISLEEWRKSK